MVLCFDFVLRLVVNTIISAHVDLMEAKESLSRKESPIRREIFCFINMAAKFLLIKARVSSFGDLIRSSQSH